MKHLQKIKEVTVRVFYRNNGHFKGVYQFNNGLAAKRFCEEMNEKSEKPLRFIIEDKQNTLYDGDGTKI